MNFVNVPDELKKQNRWVACGHAEIPISHGGKPAYCCEPTTWCSFEQAKAIAQEEGLDGVAYAVMQDDPYIVITLHDAVDSAGVLREQAASIVHRLSSYSEYTYDRTGVHIIIRGSPPVGTSSLKVGSVEVYDRFRFLRFTGDVLPSVPHTIESNQEQLLALWRQAEFVGKKDVVFELGLTDADIIDRACRSNEKFQKLWDGQGPEDMVEGIATIELLRHLAYWTHRDPVRMAQLYARSGTCEPKRWGRKSFREPSLRAALIGGITRIAKLDRYIQASGIADEEAVTMAVELAVELRNAGREMWRLAFDLAQKLQNLGGSPESYRRASDTFAEAMRVDPIDFWYEFASRWGKVKNSDADCLLARAAALAEQEPVETDTRLGLQYNQAASLVHHLGRLSRDKIFFLSGLTLGKIIGRTQRTGSSILALLQQRGVIECIDEQYSYQGKKRKAKSYRLR